MYLVTFHHWPGFICIVVINIQTPSNSWLLMATLLHKMEIFLVFLCHIEHMFSVYSVAFLQLCNLRYILKQRHQTVSEFVKTVSSAGQRDLRGYCSWFLLFLCYIMYLNVFKMFKITNNNNWKLHKVKSKYSFLWYLLV